MVTLPEQSCIFITPNDLIRGWWIDGLWGFMFAWFIYAWIYITRGLSINPHKPFNSLVFYV